MVAERANYYVVFLIGCLLISPMYIPMGFETVILGVAVVSSTLAAMVICMLAARWRLQAVEFICPMNVAFRAVAAYLTIRASLDLECVPPTLDMLRRFSNLTLFFTDLILFKTSIYTTVFITLPLLLITGGLINNIEKTPQTLICKGTLNETILGHVVIVPILVPFIYSLYMQTLGELRLFMLGETLNK